MVENIRKVITIMLRFLVEISTMIVFLFVINSAYAIILFKISSLTIVVATAKQNLCNLEKSLFFLFDNNHITYLI